MEHNLLIDLGETRNTVTKESGDELIGISNSSTNSVSHCGVTRNAVSNDRLDLLSVVMTPYKQGDRRIPSTMKFKAQSVDSLSDLNALGVLPLLGSPVVTRRQQSVGLDPLASSSMLSPFTTPKPKSTISLRAENLLDAEPEKLLSPFGWTPSQNNRRTIEEAIRVEDVPIGDLVQVQEPECTLPDDMFDIDTLGKKQLEHSKAQSNAKPAPTVQVLLPSLSSIGSGESNDNDTLNRGFLGSLSDDSSLFPTPNDSVFEEAQGLAKMLKEMGVPDSSNTIVSIEDEDGSIVYDCPDYKEDILEIDCSRLKYLQSHQNTLENKSNESTIDKKGREATNDKCQKYSWAFSDIGSPGSGCDNSSNISAISPSPLSFGSVENLKLKAKSLIGNQFNSFPLKLRASSCSSVPSSKPGPIKALMPVGQVVKSELSTPVTVGGHSKLFGTPHLQIIDSPFEGANLMRRMSSTPKPHTPDNSNSSKVNINNGSSLKKPLGNKLNVRDQVLNSGTKKPVGSTAAPTRLSSSVKPTGASAKSSASNSNPPKRASVGLLGAEASFPAKGSKHYPSPLLRRKISDFPSAMKTPSRSISTGSLSTTPSMKKMHSSPQISNLQSKGRSNSSSKLPMCYTGRPLAEASVNSPAKHNSPLHKLVSKFRRNLTPKGMKENVHPM